MHQPKITTDIGQIKSPEQLRKVPQEELSDICQSLRSVISSSLKQRGGHLGSSLGTVELTVALHYCLDTPQDKIIWDTGHQAYGHKILTGRLEKFSTLRQIGGISGFTNIKESPYDTFGAGHSSTSISASLGLSHANTEPAQSPPYIVSVIGDGALTAGLAFEGLNNAYSFSKNTKNLLILNDNGMSISKSIGSIAHYISSLQEKYPTLSPQSLKTFISNPDAFTSNAFCDFFNIRYLGIVDGHDVQMLVQTIKTVQGSDCWDKPLLLHIKTTKGKGFSNATSSPDGLHGVKAYKIQVAPSPADEPELVNIATKGRDANQQIVSSTLLEIAKKDSSIRVITPAMTLGSNLQEFAAAFPERFFDTAISEQHSAVFAAGMCLSRQVKPYLFIYSTFLQRAYDQIIHDICLQNLPVKIAIDRAGVAGEDGATHNGVFDPAFMRIIPNLAICCPSDKQEIIDCVKFSAHYNGSPFAFRYTKEEHFTLDDFNIAASKCPFKLGKGRKLAVGGSIAIICIGSMLKPALEAHKILKDQHKISISIYDARFLKPLDSEMILNAIKSHKAIIVIEENSIGGLYSSILEEVNQYRIQSDSTLNCKILPLLIEEPFVEHGNRRDILNSVSLEGRSIADTISNLITRQPPQGKF